MKTILTYTEEDFKESFRLYRRTTFSLRFISWFLPSIGTVLLLVMWLGNISSNYRALNLFFAIFFIIFPIVIVPRIAYKGFKNSKLFKVSTEIEFNEQGLSFKNEFAESKAVWGAYARSAVNDRVVLLFQNQRVYSFFPRRCFSDEAWKYFVELVEKNVKK